LQGFTTYKTKTNKKKTKYCRENSKCHLNLKVENIKNKERLKNQADYPSTLHHG